jgi:hypothetical protein
MNEDTAKKCAEKMAASILGTTPSNIDWAKSSTRG